MPNIYDDLMTSTSQLMELQEMMMDPDTDEQALADTIALVMDDFKDSAEVIGKIIRNVQAQVDALKAEEDRIKAKRQSCEKNVERLEDTIRMVMMGTGMQKLKTNLFTFSLRKSQSVVIDDLCGIPIEFLRIKAPEPDKAKIKEYIKEKGSVAYAHIEENQSLSIR